MTVGTMGHELVEQVKDIAQQVHFLSNRVKELEYNKPKTTIDNSGGVVFLSVGDIVTMKSEHFTGEIIEIFYPKNLGFHYIIEDKNQIAEWNRLRIVSCDNVESYEKRT